MLKNKIRKKIIADNNHYTIKINSEDKIKFPKITPFKSGENVPLLIVTDQHGELTDIKKIANYYRNKKLKKINLLCLGDAGDRKIKGLTILWQFFEDGGFIDQGATYLYGNHDYDFIYAMLFDDKQHTFFNNWIDKRNGGEAMIREACLLSNIELKTLIIKEEVSGPEKFDRDKVLNLPILKGLALKMIEKGELYFIKGNIFADHAGVPLDEIGYFIPYGSEKLIYHKAFKQHLFDFKSGKLRQLFDEENYGVTGIWTGYAYRGKFNPNNGSWFNTLRNYEEGENEEFIELKKNLETSYFFQGHLHQFCSWSKAKGKPPSVFVLDPSGCFRLCFDNSNNLRELYYFYSGKEIQLLKPDDCIKEAEEFENIRKKSVKQKDSKQTRISSCFLKLICCFKDIEND